MVAPAVEVEHLSHAFARKGDPLEVLDDVSFSLQPASFTSIVGPSGCGKSTILRVLSGLLAPTRGQARIHGQSSIGHTGLVAFMPQKDLLLPWRRALANATLGAEIAGVAKDEARTRALELMPRFGLQGFERSWPSQLSGGMRQRLALLRTFLHPADVLLLDEPFGALDAITRREMQQWLQSVWLQDRRTVLLVTHDVEEALVLSDEVLIMSPRPGRIVDRLAVDALRPRKPAAVTSPEFVAWKAELLSALDGFAAPP